MKSLLKLLLSLCVLIASIYAAIPLWLPFIFASQLPPGWQLEKLEVAYPGFSGISINMLHVNGELQAARLAVTATDIRFNYQGPTTEIDSLVLDVFMRAADNSDAEALTLDDLSLPITRLTGKLPQLSVSHMQVILHSGINIGTEKTTAVKPLVLDFQVFELLPLTDDGFQLSSDISIEDIPGIHGRLDIDVSTNSRKVVLRFPSATGSPAWLDVSLEQADNSLDTTTKIHAVVDTEPADQEWLDEIVARSTGGLLAHMNGKLVFQADFSGKEVQGIKQLSLLAENLQAELEEGTLILNAEFLADREGENINVSLPQPFEIQFQDATGKIDNLIVAAVPGLQRTSRSPVMVFAEISNTSKLIFQTGTERSMQFNGDIKLDLIFAESNINLQASDVQAGFEGFSGLDTVTANGLITLNWEEGAPFSYITDDVDLKADKLSLASAGQFQFADQNLNFKQTGDFDIHNPVITLPGDEKSPTITIVARELSIAAKLDSHDGGLVSTGSGTFLDGRIAPMEASADIIDLTWQELDLLKLAGKLSTKTQGFATDFDGETWTGFDFDITYSLRGNDDINGSGIVKFDAGTELPIEFAGNTQAEHWDVTLLPATIKLTQLGGLLRVAHFELPESVKLTDGYIDMHGDVVVDDEITANVTINGHELGASMLESSAGKANFSFNSSYGSTISASGPVSIETVALAGGVDVAHISADLNMENAETFTLENLYAEVFDGQLKLGKLRFSDNRVEDTTVELHHINLGRILAFADIDGLEGTGFLEISLPVGSDQTGIYVKNGTFKSAGPGLLAYTKEGVAGSNVGLQALENFQYKDLSGTVNYQSDGAYQITIRLEGKNPDLYGGHPIVFNLNIGGSLPELFEAMFMTGSFEESILKQIRTNSSD